MKLSKREHEVLSRLHTGASNKDIANEIGVSEATVKHYVFAMSSALRLSNRLQLAIWAWAVYGYGRTVPLETKAAA